MSGTPIYAGLTIAKQLRLGMLRTSFLLVAPIVLIVPSQLLRDLVEQRLLLPAIELEKEARSARMLQS